MNKKLTLALLLPLIASCGPANQPIKLDIESTLNDFKNGIKLDVTLNETHDNETKTYYFKNTSKEKEFSFIQYSDETKTVEALHEYYIASEDEYIYATRLNVNNEYNLYEVYNPSTYDYYTWEDGYNNAFLSLSTDDFNKVNDSSYTLKETSLTTANNELTTLFYGNPGLTLTSLTLTQDKDGLTFTGSMVYESSYNYEFSAVVLEKGVSTECDPRMEPFANVSDASFETMLNSLKGNNYTATVENYINNELEYTGHYYTEEDVVLVENMGYTLGYYNVEEGVCQEVYKDGDNFYKNGAPVEGSLDEIRPLFSLSRACFDLSNGVYVLKDKIEGEIYTVTLLESYAEELDNFTIQINNDSYVFTNIMGSYKTVVTITNVGTTDCGFDEESVLEPTLGTTWEDVLGEQLFANIYEIAGEEAYNIPVPEGYSEWGCEYIEDEITFAFLYAEAKETFEDDFFLYAYSLIEAGYMMYEEEEGYAMGGIMFLKEAKINDEAHVLVVEIFEYYDAFGIAVYIGE